jgi:hypothetical protein
VARQAGGTDLPDEGEEFVGGVLLRLGDVLERDPVPGRDQLRSDPHGVRRAGSRHEPAAEGAAEQPLLQQAAQLGSGAHGHVGNRSAPVCVPSGARVAAASWQLNWTG